MEPGIFDEIVLSRANTADKDFGELVFWQHRLMGGVVLIRLAGLSGAQKADLVAAAINQHLTELLGAFAVITSETIRIRRVEN